MFLLALCKKRFYVCGKEKERIMANEKIKAAIAACKFYKGEKKNPYDHPKEDSPDNQNKAMLWYYEEKFCQFTKENDGLLDNALAEYKLYKGKNLPGIDEKLLALLFNRYFHWAETSPTDKNAMADFYKFIEKYYL